MEVTFRSRTLPATVLKGGLIPRELLNGPAALPIIIDAVRRGITKSQRQHGFFTNCCARTHKENIHGEECSACAGEVDRSL